MLLSIIVQFQFNFYIKFIYIKIINKYLGPGSSPIRIPIFWSSSLSNLGVGSIQVMHFGSVESVWSGNNGLWLSLSSAGEYNVTVWWTVLVS